ncbi:MAG: hypothetical protein FGM46_06545 [Ferruginibacter sp.]|nr:hypothetical protein [Ferruginibacter sp.]
MKKLLVLLTSIVAMNFVAAQENVGNKKSRREERRQRIDAIIRQEEEGVIKFRKHTVFGFKLANDGYGAFLEVASNEGEMILDSSIRWNNQPWNSYPFKKRTLLFQLDISERKHVKEQKLRNDFSPTAPVIYGKINYFYPVKLGVQQQILLGNKSNKNGVCVTGNFGGGISMAFLRPYLVEVDKGGGNYVFVGYESPDQNYFINGPIIGGPNLGIGWEKLKLIPGLYVKPAVRFDYGKYNELVSALEVGVNAEYYFKNIPQMINIKQNRFFFNGYVSIVFGRRK